MPDIISQIGPKQFSLLEEFLNFKKGDIKDLGKKVEKIEE